MALADFPRRDPFEEYDIGQVLRLDILSRPVTPLPEQVTAARKLQVRVRRFQKPRTLSCCMVVDILAGAHHDLLPTTAFLKLFDRRFAEQHRYDNRIKPWTKDTEQNYIKSVQNGEVRAFLRDLHNAEDFKDKTKDGWDDAQNEAYLADELLKLYTAEAATYDALQTHQGSVIPRLLAAVDLDITPLDVEAQPTWPVEPFRIKGILLQHIEGFSLREVPIRTPRALWQGLVDRAVAITHVLGDHNIMNKDVRLDNFLVSDKGDGSYDIFMIDFGLCRFREQNESDLDWGRAKWTTDEEGVVGLLMQVILKRHHKFRLHYENSERYLEWAEREEEGDNTSRGYVPTEVRPVVSCSSAPLHPP